MWHIFALVNVLGFPVHSVYPAVQNAGTDRALRNINVTPSASAKSTCTNASVRCGVTVQTQQKRDGVQIILCPFYLPMPQDLRAENGLQPSLEAQNGSWAPQETLPLRLSRNNHLPSTSIINRQAFAIKRQACAIKHTSAINRQTSINHTSPVNRHTSVTNHTSFITYASAII